MTHSSTDSSTGDASTPLGLEGQLSAGDGLRTADAAMASAEGPADGSEDDPFGDLAVLDRRTSVILTSVARAMYPHDQLPDVHYQRVVASLDGKAKTSAQLADVLSEGVGFLATTTGRRPEEFGDLPEADQVRALARLEETPFFRAVAAEVVVHLYSQPDVWPYFGYEGPSNDLGGYLHRGFDDIDWLDDAPDRRGQPVPNVDGTTGETGQVAVTGEETVLA